MPNTPAIQTARLRLRAHSTADYEAAYAMWSDPRVTQFIGGIPSTRQQTWSRILTYAGHWSLLGFGYWAMEDASSGAFIGEIGFADFHRDIAPSMQNVPELGFALTPQAHGKGYATEAVRAVLAWGDENLPSRRTVCLINPENAASVRVAQKNGYEIFERTTFNGNPTLFLQREAPPVDLQRL